jgi:hypothetical protein
MMARLIQNTEMAIKRKRPTSIVGGRKVPVCRRSVQNSWPAAGLVDT